MAVFLTGVAASPPDLAVKAVEIQHVIRVDQFSMFAAKVAALCLCAAATRVSCNAQLHAHQVGVA